MSQEQRLESLNCLNSLDPLDSHCQPYLQGEVVVNPKTGLPQFVPGRYDDETGKFVPGMVVDTIDGPMFVDGVLHRYLLRIFNVPNNITFVLSHFNIF